MSHRENQIWRNDLKEEYTKGIWPSLRILLAKTFLSNFLDPEFYIMTTQDTFHTNLQHQPSIYVRKTYIKNYIITCRYNEYLCYIYTPYKGIAFVMYTNTSINIPHVRCIHAEKRCSDSNSTGVIGEGSQRNVFQTQLQNIVEGREEQIPIGVN